MTHRGPFQPRTFCDSLKPTEPKTPSEGARFWERSAHSASRTGPPPRAPAAITLSRFPVCRRDGSAAGGASDAARWEFGAARRRCVPGSCTGRAAGEIKTAGGCDSR